MGFLLDYPEGFLPKLIINTLYFLGCIIATINSFFSFLGISKFLEPPPYVPENQATNTPAAPPLSAVLIRELLPAMKFSDLDASAGQPPESCAVCLYEFEGSDKIRTLLNCKHIFHSSCLDRWMDHDRQTCPLCRKHFVPPHLLGEFDQRLWEASYVDDHDSFSDDNFASAF